jgi:AcrR family transcriptional regulator
MKVSTSDPRVIRTQERLRAALIDLISEKSITSLTIQDVTNRAGLNRTTFYLHYSGLHELLEDCARALFSEMRTEIYMNKPSYINQDVFKLEPFVESVFRHLEKHKIIYQAMLGKQGDPYFRVLFHYMEWHCDFIAQALLESLLGGWKMACLFLWNKLPNKLHEIFYLAICG